jgi:type I site-specific restriction endonuclease
MSMNEADTRYHLIDPVLRDKGYVSRDHVTLETVLTPPPVEPSGPKGRRRKGPGRTDYLLCVQVQGGPKAMPVAVLEAKKDKAARGLESQAAAIDAAVLDLKAANPNAVATVDTRTPAEIIASIDAQGRIVAQARGRLSALLAFDTPVTDAHREIRQ